MMSPRRFDSAPCAPDIRPWSYTQSHPTRVRAELFDVRMRSRLVGARTRPGRAESSLEFPDSNSGGN